MSDQGDGRCGSSYWQRLSSFSYLQPKLRVRSRLGLRCPFPILMGSTSGNAVHGSTAGVWCAVCHLQRCDGVRITRSFSCARSGRQLCHTQARLSRFLLDRGCLRAGALGVGCERQWHSGLSPGRRPSHGSSYRSCGLHWQHGFPGFWRMAGKHWRNAMGEWHRSPSKRAFVRALQRLLPEIRDSDLVRGGSGVRAQALNPDGALVDDFQFVPSGKVLHVLNVPSPAATASLMMGKAIVDTAASSLGLG